MVLKEKDYTISAITIQKILIAMCIVGTLLLIGCLLKYCSYGIDFTDESFYLVWMHNPFIYDGSVTQFGFIYHPLYKLVGGDITTLRQINILLTFGLSVGLTWSFLISLFPTLKENKFNLFIFSAGLSTSSFILFHTWLPTPSYNSLTLQGLLITITGLILTEKNLSRINTLGWILISLGGWIVFMAKPTTALILGMCVVSYLLFVKKFILRMFIFSIFIALSLLLISALLMDGSILNFIERLRLGSEFAKLMDGGHVLSRILRVDVFRLGKKFHIFLLSVFSTLLLTIWCMLHKDKKIKLIGLFISSAGFIFIGALTLGLIHYTADLGRFQGMLIFGIVFAIIGSTLILSDIKLLKNISKSEWATALLFIIMPHIYAFGTNVNYWELGSMVAIFWLLAGITLLKPLFQKNPPATVILPVIIATQAVTALLLQTAIEQPRRQPQPLRLNSFSLEIAPQKSKLVLSQGYFEYMQAALTVAENAKFQPNTPVIDLSGQSPGILYAIGAKNIGHPWTLGGYPGSLYFVKAGLSHFSCQDIANAWVLYESDGPRKISNELMLNVGSSFPNDYECMGTWNTAKGAGGYDTIRLQELYKPKDPNKTLMTCNALRGIS